RRHRVGRCHQECRAHRAAALTWRPTAARRGSSPAYDDERRPPLRASLSRFDARRAGRSLTVSDIASPLVSLIVRSSARSTLQAALDSVALQDYPNMEVIVVAASGRDHPGLPGR